MSSFYKRKVFNITKELKQKKFRMVKCPVCQFDVDRNADAFTTHSNRHYHEECFAPIKYKNQDRKELIDYILILHKMKHPGVVVKQIKEFEEDYGYTLKGIEFALKYFHEVLGNPVDRVGIGIVPWVYEDAKRHYGKVASIRRSASEAGLSNEEEVIHVELPTKKKIIQYIDIEGL